METLWATSPIMTHRILPLPCFWPIGLSLYLILATQPTYSADALTRPTPVEIGVYLVDVYDLDIKSSSYSADFYVWHRWSGDLDPTKFEAMNGQIQIIGEPDRYDDGDFHWRCYRCQGKFRAVLGFHLYPMDTHVLEIQLEDSTHDERSLHYVPDRDSLAQSSSFYMGPWEQDGAITATAMNFEYPTSYGNPTRLSNQLAKYSRLILRIPIRRAGGASRIYGKTFLAMFISVGIAMLAFLIDPTDLDPRFGVGVAGIFGAVSSMLVVSGAMPEHPYFSLSDKLHLFSLVTIFLTLLISCFSLRLAKSGHPRRSNRLDVLGGVGLTCFYVAGVVLFSKCVF